MPAPAVASFLNSVRAARSGDTGLIPEEDIHPIDSLPHLETLPNTAASSSLLKQLTIIKLNGGLGTGMGLDGPKSLIRVRGDDTFLDFIAKQILHLRSATGGKEPSFYIMNSFATRGETLEHLARYPQLAKQEGGIDFVQSKVPKLDANSFEPLSWPDEPELEWCPPGHGDIYPSLLGSGLLERLLSKGIKYLFVSNSDNLGASVDLRLLAYFAASRLSFLMEVAERTAADRKGGHLARRKRSGRLLLRESAQCPAQDESAFQDINLHRFFNTNNLWLRLDDLKTEIDRCRGALPLPIIRNLKTIDPRKPESPRVLQLESAIGAAIECFERSGAVVVPRSRFAPVKTTSDLLAVRSDSYRVTEEFNLVLAESRFGEPPLVNLDPAHYKMLDDFENYFAEGPPSLAECISVKVVGRIKFAAGVVCRGRVEFYNPTPEIKRVPEGSYWESRIEF